MPFYAPLQKSIFAANLKGNNLWQESINRSLYLPHSTSDLYLTNFILHGFFNETLNLACNRSLHLVSKLLVPAPELRYLLTDESWFLYFGLLIYFVLILAESFFAFLISIHSTSWTNISYGNTPNRWGYDQVLRAGSFQITVESI